MNAVHPSPRPGARSTAACGLALLLLAGSATARTNRFSDVYTGAEVAGGTERMDLTNNTFVRNYGQAIVVGFLASGGTGGYRPGTVALRDNTIAVPADPQPGGQVPPNAEVVGIQLLALPNGGKELVLENNEIQGQGGNPNKPSVGFEAQLCFDYHYVQRQNQFLGLDAGIRLMDAAANTSHEDYVTDNYFQQCQQAVVLTGGLYASLEPVVSCNTFEENKTAIAITANSTVALLSGPLGGPAGLEPVANQYTGSVKDLDNIGRYALQYLASANPPEGPTYTSPNPQPQFIGIPGTPCTQRQYSYGTGTYGLQRPGAGAAGAGEWQRWQEHLTAMDGPDEELYRLTLRLIDYHEATNQLPQLEAFANTLPIANAPAFDRLSLYLMERYRRLGQATDAQRVRDELLRQRGGNKEMGYRVAYFDVAGRLATLHPGARPAVADSAALADVAGSPADFAPVACATLRYFYPSLTCRTDTGNGNAAARPAAVRPGPAPVRPATVRAYPNPAHDQIALEMAGLQAVRLVLIATATGQVVAQQAVAGQQHPVVSVAGLAPGIYRGQLVSATGQTVGACKIVVIH